MKITPLNNLHQNVKFNGEPKLNNIKKDPQNPISTGFETIDVIKASIIAGFGVAARTLYWVCDDKFLSDTFKAGQNIARKNHKNISENKIFALGIVSWGALILGGMGIVAAIYALLNTPKSVYEGTINAHKKTEEMDVYLAGNKIDKELYKEIGTKAKNAKTWDEKEQIRKEHMLLKAARTDIPEFLVTDPHYSSFKNIPS